MALGQAAGTAAHLAIHGGRRVRAIDVEALQRMLLGQGQVITYFKDIDRADPAYAALQYFGSKGFFPDYYARSREPLERTQAAEWLKIAELTEAEAARVYRELGLHSGSVLWGMHRCTPEL